MNAIQVIGDADTVLAFALGGIPGQVVRTAEEARTALEAVVTAVHHGGGPVQQPTLLLITSGTAERIRDALDTAILDPNAPLILEFSGFGDTPGASPVERFVGRVLGVHL